MVQEIGMTGMLRTGIGGRFIQYFAMWDLDLCDYLLTYQYVQVADLNTQYSLQVI